MEGASGGIGGSVGGVEEEVDVGVRQAPISVIGLDFERDMRELLTAIVCT